MAGAVYNMKICLSILTTGTRPETLSFCLNSITKLRLPVVDKFSVLIVENNALPNEGVVSLINSLSETSDIEFTHVLEPKKGIPYGRNAGLKFAIDNNYSHLAFVDDDAEIDIEWLYELVTRLKKDDVQAVTGPQKPIFPKNTKPVFKNATVYKERNLDDGKLCKWAATNNVLFDVKFANENGIWFSEDMKTGGSDKEFFSRYSKAGAKICWVKNAIVNEYVENERINFSWAIKRTFRFGGTGYRIEQSNKGKSLALAFCFLKGAIYILKGFLGCLLLPLKKNKSWLDGPCDIAHGVAFFTSVFTGGKLKKYT